MASTPTTTKTRTEHDLLGDFQVPADAYYGVQTARALENFQISGVRLRHYPNFIKGLAMVKLGAARANHDDRRPLEGESSPRSRAPARKSSTASSTTSSASTCYQGGAGTSTNMNANEVIANRGSS